MSRNAMRLTVDIALFLAMLGLVATGLLMSFVLPPRSGPAEVWGSTRHEWGDIHFWLAMSVLIVAAVHLALNWGWVCNVAIRLRGGMPNAVARRRRNLAGGVFVLAVAAVVGGFLWAASASVSAVGFGRGQHRLDVAAGTGGSPGSGGGRQFRGGRGAWDSPSAPSGDPPNSQAP